jgi:hypothetical protein
VPNGPGEELEGGQERKEQERGGGETGGTPTRITTEERSGAWGKESRARERV